MAMVVSSSAFRNGLDIPVRYTCDGENVSPPISWSGTPGNAASLALICEDPDAPSGNWVHWVVFDLDPGVRAIPEGVKRGQSVLNGAKVGKNDFREARYGGPCPPEGKPHRYFFRVFALDTELAGVREGATRDEVIDAMQGHVIDRGELMGTYVRHT